MKITILGSGTSTGVPVIGCNCNVCTSPSSFNKRLRASIAVKPKGKDHSLIIDTGPDFRTQVLRAGISRVKNVFYTHLHADHCHGFDDLRAFYFFNKEPIKCYMGSEYLKEFQERFSYAFVDTGYKGVTPQIDLTSLPEGEFDVSGVTVESRSFEHGAVNSYGFKFNDFCYVTDFKKFTEKDIKHWRGKIKVMVASGVHFRFHFSHSVIQETIKLFQDLKVERGIISHLSHEVDYHRDKNQLPKNVEFAYDEMEIEMT